ncbi:MAG: hypothetical protein JWO69_1633, partial [Thermoleophilia bacterium]|nr:hypothetical protein [Thermoleophilia bacterium]
WQTVYDRSMAPAIENGVNNLVGIRSKEEQAKDTLPALERFTRSASRGVAVGATTYVLGSALQNTMVHLGASIGGVGGLLVGMAGAALIGSVGGTVVDATIGPAIGRFGGQIYTWITGKPAYEQRMKDAAKGPSSAPGDPVNAPNGNPGTVPSEAAAPAPGAPGAVTAPMAPPVEGQPKKRKRTGNAAVDRTAPAMNVPSAKLVQVAAAS